MGSNGITKEYFSGSSIPEYEIDVIEGRFVRAESGRWAFHARIIIDATLPDGRRLRTVSTVHVASIRQEGRKPRYDGLFTLKDKG